jgi:hypothetical protein
MKTASLRLQNAIELIDNSEIFELSRESNPSKYRILEYELIENLYEYAQFLNSNRYQDMGLEIVETATDCLRSYDKNRGLFTHYFLTSLSRRVNKEQAIRNAIETRGGIVVPEKVQKQITDIQLIAGTLGRDIEDEAVIEAAAKYLDVPTARVRKLMWLNAQCAVVHDSETEDAVGVLNLISDDFVLEDYVFEKTSLVEIFNAIDICFSRCRRSQQEVVSQLLTLRLLSCPQDIIQLAVNRSFFDSTLYQNYINTGYIPTARDISSKLNKDEASTSRTFSTFGKKLKDYLSELHWRRFYHE